MIGLVAILVLMIVLSHRTYNAQAAKARKGAYEVIVVEGCQYFMCPSYYGCFVLTHKGNCTNSIHAR